MDPLQSILQQQGLSATAFPLTSRYYGIETVTMEKENGETIIFLSRRFVPQSDRFSLLQEHTVTQGDRLDNITNRYLGDPEQFWQLCDANNVLHPEELTESIGSKIRITLPEGIPGNNNA
ncbi:MAG: LysM peptidoglycan-binding domain-containing protein [Bacteroidales bacterium]|nr:LysM peptidoglycan-binding domain-containing protein [Bacteroidales bacterium]